MSEEKSQKQQDIIIEFEQVDVERVKEIIALFKGLRPNTNQVIVYVPKAPKKTMGGLFISPQEADQVEFQATKYGGVALFVGENLTGFIKQGDRLFLGEMYNITKYAIGDNKVIALDGTSVSFAVTQKEFDRHEKTRKKIVAELKKEEEREAKLRKVELIGHA